jgi:hypothetical protein
MSGCLITGINYPGSIASKNGQYGIEYMGHLLEVFGVLNSLVDPVHTLKKPEPILRQFVGSPAFGDASVFRFHERPIRLQTSHTF